MKLFFKKNREIHLHMKKSVFRQYVVLYTLMILLSCILVGTVFGLNFLHIINRQKEQVFQEQAATAVSSLNMQYDLMAELPLKLSIQPSFSRSYVFESSFHRITVADLLSTYNSYCGLADSFALIYSGESGEKIIFHSDGVTTEMETLLIHYELPVSKYDEIASFLFDATTRGRTLILSNCLLIAFPVHENTISKYNVDESSVLVYFVPLPSIEQWIFQTSFLEADNISVLFDGHELIPIPENFQSVSISSEGPWEIVAGWESRSFLTLFETTSDYLRILGCVFVLILFAFGLAWYCYLPIRTLTQKYAEVSDEHEKNEFFVISQTLEQMQERTKALADVASDQKKLLYNYSLLGLMNNAFTLNDFSSRMKTANIVFEYDWFSVFLVLPSAGLPITEENISVLLRSFPDLSEEDSLIYSAESNSENHTLALLCNMKTKDCQAAIAQRLHTYLSHFQRQFYVSEGSVTDSYSISASYLTAQSKLKMIERSLTSYESAPSDGDASILRLVRLLAGELESGNCPGALNLLDRCMSVLRSNASELLLRYNIMTLTSALQQLCAQINFPLTDAQLSMLLPSNNLQSVHYELLQLIPAICEYMNQSNAKTVLSTNQMVLDYLNEHFCDYDISVQSIAEAIGIGINRCAGIIKDATGTNLKTALAEKRLDLAKKLLKETDTSIADIGSKLGYGSASYFIRVFKGAVGLTPDAYRKSFESE